MSVNVTVFYGSDQAHASQVFTGLAMLHKSGAIRLTQRRASRPHRLIFAEANDIPICFDVRDPKGIDQDALEQVDVYFKRGYNPTFVSDPKVRPLGLNYEVYCDGLDPLALRRHRSLTALGLRWAPRVSNTSGLPGAGNGVLFLTRLWEIEGKKAADRECINEQRIKTVEALRKEHGAAFVGGIQDSEIARHLCPKLIAPAALTAKPAYLAAVRRAAICVTTIGLHQSNGWKLAEYVAMSKAIVNEPMVHLVPGQFREGANYLSFTTPEQCVEQTVRLRESVWMREAMQQANRRYYLEHVRPDRLVYKAIAHSVTAPATPPHPAAVLSARSSAPPRTDRAGA